MILYITGRPDMQKQRVVSWLSQHNFPQGMIFFSDGLVHDPLRQKAIFLRNLMQEVGVRQGRGFHRGGVSPRRPPPRPRLLRGNPGGAPPLPHMLRLSKRMPSWQSTFTCISSVLLLPSEVCISSVSTDG